MALLSLLKDRLISLTADDQYRVRRLPPYYDRLSDPAFRLQWEFSIEQINVLSKIHDKLDSQSGHFTIHNLYNEVISDPTKYPYANFNVLVHEKITTGEFILKDDRVWRRDKLFIPMPSYIAPSPQPQKTPV